MAGKQHRDWTREEHILAFNLLFIDEAMSVRFRENNPLRKEKPRLGLVVELRRKRDLYTEEV
jgi:hypothetical protein